MQQEAMNHAAGTLVRSHRERMERVMRYMDEHANETLGLERLAGVAHLSPHHFHRVFKAYAGLNVAAYVRRRRLILAADRLASTSRSVLAIALDAGFGSHESFTRAFSALFGCTPSAYRERSRTAPAHALPAPNPLPVQGGSDMEMQLTEVPRMRVACVRHVGPYSSCQPAWDALCAWGVRENQFGPDSVFLGISWDEPDATPPEEIRYDACVTVADTVAAGDGVDIRHVGGGRHACAVHLGPFEGLEATYRQLYAAILAQEDLAIGQEPAFEIYRTDPKTTPPDKLVTEIYVPLAS